MVIVQAQLICFISQGEGGRVETSMVIVQVQLTCFSSQEEGGRVETSMVIVQAQLTCFISQGEGGTVETSMVIVQAQLTCFISQGEGSRVETSMVIVQAQLTCFISQGEVHVGRVETSMVIVQALLTCFTVTCGFQSLFLSMRDKLTVPLGNTLGWKTGGSNTPERGETYISNVYPLKWRCTFGGGLRKDGEGGGVLFSIVGGTNTTAGGRLHFGKIYLLKWRYGSGLRGEGYILFLCWRSIKFLSCLGQGCCSSLLGFSNL